MRESKKFKEKFLRTKAWVKQIEPLIRSPDQLTQFAIITVDHFTKDEFVHIFNVHDDDPHLIEFHDSIDEPK